MSFLSSWKFWTLLYLVSAVLFAQSFKKLNRNMKKASLLTVLLEACTALVSLIFIFFFPLEFSNDIGTYFILLLVVTIYAVTDRLNIEVRYGLDPSTFSMLKQLSTVFIILFGIIFLNDSIVLYKIIGAAIVIVANLLLACEKGKFKFNKYFIMAVVSNILFAVAMLINVNISSQFNIAIYTFITTFVPSIIIFIFGRFNFRDLKEELKLYDKKLFLFVALMWSLMLISSVKAYEFGNIVVVSSFLALTSILNAAVELVFNHNRKTFFKKLFIAILIIIGVILVKM